MSTRHTGAVWLSKVGDPVAKLVLLSLAEHADMGTGECWPSNRRLAVMTELDERTIRRKLAYLEELGLIRRTLNQGRKGTNLYQLVVEGAPDRPDAGGWGHAAPHPRALCPPPPGTPPPGTVIEPSGNDARAPQLLPEGWLPTAAALSKAREDFPNVDIRTETLRFVDRNRADGIAITDPTAAWRAWLGRAVQFQKRDDQAAAAAGRAGAGRRGHDRTAAPGLRSRMREGQGVVVEGLAGPPVRRQ